MDIFEYVAVLTSIIIGLGMAHLLRGVVRIIQRPDRYRVYWVHVGWVINMFFQLGGIFVRSERYHALLVIGCVAYQASRAVRSFWTVA